MMRVYLATGVLVAATVAGLVSYGGLSGGGSKPRPPARVFYQPSGVEQSAAGVQFARDFRGVVNAESVVAHSTRFVSHISCLTGDPNHFFCAWLVATPEGPRCYAGMVERDGADIRPLGGSKDSVGRVRLSVARCGALNAIRSLK